MPRFPLPLLSALLAAGLLAACASPNEDKTAGWSTDKIYSEARDELNAGATDKAVRGDEREALLRRIGLAAGKYWVCKRATPHAGEAMECLGGNGYAEESGMPRLYREAPLMGIWKAPAISVRWIPCAPWQPGPNAWRCSSTKWPPPPATSSDGQERCPDWCRPGGTSLKRPKSS